MRINRGHKFKCTYLMRHKMTDTIFFSFSPSSSPSQRQRSQDFEQSDNHHQDSKDSVAKSGKNKQILKRWDSKTEFLVGDLLLEKFLTNKKGQLLATSSEQVPDMLLTTASQVRILWGAQAFPFSFPCKCYFHFAKPQASQKHPKKRNPVSCSNQINSY